MTVSTQTKDQHPSALSTVLTPVHAAGYPFIAGAAVLTLIMLVLWWPLGLLGLVVTLWVVYFFRDPVRTIPEDDQLILSPADGRVQSITQAPLPPELKTSGGEHEDGAERTATRISIFLNVFDVHVNRIPIGGHVDKVVYTPGKFVNAALDKASVDNERSSFQISTRDGRQVVVTQIAGLVARRIICNVKSGQGVQAGSRFGLIRFGSRVDVYLPANAVPSVAPGQRAIGGETILADLAGTRPALRARQE
jgi:phosphatidylserine decarboxylase